MLEELVIIKLQRDISERLIIKAKELVSEEERPHINIEYLEEIIRKPDITAINLEDIVKLLSITE